MKQKLIFFIFLLISFEIFAEELRWILHSDDGKAVAICTPVTERSSTCIVSIQGVEVDISGAEGANLGTLGTRERSAYEKVISFPSKWLLIEDDGYMVEITTQAWFEGLRYTRKQPAYVKNGKYHSR